MLYLPDCYNQFTWSNPTRCTALFSVYFNVIVIQWGAICPTSCIHRIAVFLRSFTCFLPSVILPFLRFVPLVVVVVPFCVFSQSEMLNASLISSFYSTGFNNFQFYSTGFNNFQFYSTGFITTLSFDLGLPFLCPFLQDPFTRSVPAIRAILLLPCPYTCATFFFCAIWSCSLWQSCMIYLGETLIGLTP